MKKHVPNILLLIVLFTNLILMFAYVQNNGLGMFFRATGIVFLVLGIFIFIFFLSIDPGYGWAKSIDLTKNYIMIFTSVAVCITGIVLIISGQHVAELQEQSKNQKQRCQEILSGNAEKILAKEWYRLRDKTSRKALNAYLFQKKSDRNNYKIIATLVHINDQQFFRNLLVSSRAISQVVNLAQNESTCTGIFEKNISIDFDKHQKIEEKVEFDLEITISENPALETTRLQQKKTVRFTLKNESSRREQKFNYNTQLRGQEPELRVNAMEAPALAILQR